MQEEMDLQFLEFKQQLLLVVDTSTLIQKVEIQKNIMVQLGLLEKI